MPEQPKQKPQIWRSRVSGRWLLSWPTGLASTHHVTDYPTWHHALSDCDRLYRLRRDLLRIM